MLRAIFFYSILLVFFFFWASAYGLDLTQALISTPPQDSIRLNVHKPKYSKNMAYSTMGSEFYKRSDFSIYYSSHRLFCDKYYNDFNNFLNDYRAFYGQPLYTEYAEYWTVKELGFNMRYKNNLFIHMQVDSYSSAYSVKYYEHTDDNGDYTPEHTDRYRDTIIIPKLGLQRNFHERENHSLFIRGSLGYPIQNAYHEKKLDYDGHAFQYAAFAPNVSVVAGGEMGLKTFRMGMSFGYDLIPMKYKNIFNQKKLNFGGEFIELYYLANLDNNALGFEDINSFKIRHHGLFLGFGTIDHETYNKQVEAINLANLPQDDSLHAVEHNPRTTGRWFYDNLGFESMMKPHLYFRLDAGYYRTEIIFKDNYNIDEVTYNAQTRSKKIILLPALGMRYYYFSTSKFDVFSEVLAGFPVPIINQQTKDLDYTVSFPSVSGKASSGILYGSYWFKVEFEASYLYMPMELTTPESSTVFDAGDFYIGCKLWLKF